MSDQPLKHVQEAIDRFSALDSDTKIRFLARLAFELTIAARATYVPQSDDIDDPAAIRHINEATHRVTSQLTKMIESESERYPDDVLITMILAHRASARYVLMAIRSAFEWLDRKRS